MTDMTVSQTMLSQLGGNRFIAMTGSKNFVGSDDALSFKLVPNQSKAKYMRIVLTSMDGKRGRSNPVAVTFRGYSVRPFNGQSECRIGGQSCRQQLKNASVESAHPAAGNL